MHNLGLREDGTVAAWGYGASGRTNVPIGLSNVIQVAAGNTHSLALKEDGTAVAWGSNLYGQGTVPSWATNLSKIAAGTYHNLGLRKDGTVIGWGEDGWGALDIPADLTNVLGITAGDSLSYALLSNGTVRAWGYGGFGAVTIPSVLSNVVQISAGHTHLLALKSDGSVVGLGMDSGWGETEPPAGLSNVLQVAAGYFLSMALLNDGTVRVWGLNNYGQATVPTWLGDTKQISAGGWHALALAYSPALLYPIDVTRDLLLIYNANSQDSITVKDYYLATRPGVAGANTLGVNCTVAEQIHVTDFTNSVRTPVLDWLAANPTKRPEYVVLFLDVPSRVWTTNPPINLSGVPYRLRNSFPHRKPYVSSINMGASGTADCLAYIDKLAMFGSAYSPGKLYIRPSVAGYPNTNYYFDDAQRPNTNDTPGRAALAQVLTVGVSSNAITYADGYPATAVEQHILAATNVAGYFAWGWNGCMGGDYALGPSPAHICPFTFPGLTFTGSSGWFIIHTYESFNGQRVTHQGNFIDWFSSNAFGGTGYSNTPVGAVGQVEEPSASIPRPAYFAYWAAGRNFAIAAWLSNQTPFIQAVGDPFITR